jgi:hypothetical protein
MFSSSQPENREIITQKILCYDRKLAGAIFKTCHWAQVFFMKDSQSAYILFRLGMNVETSSRIQQRHSRFGKTAH